MLHTGPLRKQSLSKRENNLVSNLEIYEKKVILNYLLYMTSEVS